MNPDFSGVGAERHNHAIQPTMGAQVLRYLGAASMLLQGTGCRQPIAADRYRYAALTKQMHPTSKRITAYDEASYPIIPPDRISQSRMKPRSLLRLVLTGSYRTELALQPEGDHADRIP